MNSKKMFGWIKEGNLTIQENLFRIIVLIGEAAAIWILFENMMVNGLSYAMLPSIIITFFFSTSAYLTFVKHKVKAGSILTGLALTLIAFPQSFLTTGGVESGTSIWFILGIFYTFMMSLKYFSQESLNIRISSFSQHLSVPGSSFINRANCFFFNPRLSRYSRIIFPCPLYKKRL